MLHSGCVEKSQSYDFGCVCFKDFNRIRDFRTRTNLVADYRQLSSSQFGGTHELIYVTRNGTAKVPINREAWAAAGMLDEFYPYLGGAKGEASR